MYLLFFFFFKMFNMYFSTRTKPKKREREREVIQTYLQKFYLKIDRNKKKHIYKTELNEREKFNKKTHLKDGRLFLACVCVYLNCMKCKIIIIV